MAASSECSASLSKRTAEERARRAEAAARNSEPVPRQAKSKACEHLASEHSLDQLAWVTHEDCERFSHDFGTVLDVEELVAGSGYTLEVSSPGLDRRLTTRADYQRFQASLVKVRTWDPIAGNRHWQGRLTEVKPKELCST